MLRLALEHYPMTLWTPFVVPRHSWPCRISDERNPPKKNKNKTSSASRRRPNLGTADTHRRAHRGVSGGDGRSRVSERPARVCGPRAGWGGSFVALGVRVSFRRLFGIAASSAFLRGPHRYHGSFDEHGIVCCRSRNPCFGRPWATNVTREIDTGTYTCPLSTCPHTDPINKGRQKDLGRTYFVWCFACCLNSFPAAAHTHEVFHTHGSAPSPIHYCVLFLAIALVVESSVLPPPPCPRQLHLQGPRRSALRDQNVHKDTPSLSLSTIRLCITAQPKRHNARDRSESLSSFLNKTK
ncbi:hypothetical protein EDB83DRAFT_803772 [Lactarius deliciosus]|nr:hypothetical protein EDB83DRAFT_803772 [Lactarius deliciosus]